MKKNTVFLKTAGKAAGLLTAGLPPVLLALGLAALASLTLAGCDSMAHDDCSKTGNCYPYDKCDSIRCSANNGELGDCDC
jgi:hypothetical protein